MPPRKDAVPVTDEVWHYAFLAKTRFRLTDQQIGDWLGYSSQRVKQLRQGLVRYKRPDGTWTIGKPPLTEETPDGDS